ncbi:rRNA maturation RNase YbeY [Rhodocytophaga rosea]|uniref:Endoribonuclease YbeY n=1 Tax=Rhodocytophaga rosea TaxID=2704465 RepID=A0A6C0GJC2_9BACT|nr:rRNA maturation RNase YbeY [Rhodocytophaga rosea]QHT67904.1 rRNA maturation RNase YbeY [Rhodocytophaga rosea]
MLTSNIEFFCEDISFSLPNPTLISEWIIYTIHSECYKFESLTIVFCSDQYLLSINQSFLQHDFFTDIITFDNSDVESVIEGDLFISIDRVSENSKTYNNSFIEELYRVIIHGVLHLLGYNDKASIDKILMKQKENYYLSILKL